MRESGFDPSNRFGASNVDVIHYAPVCLNTLLYVMEDDAAGIMATLGRRDGGAHLARRGLRRGARPIGPIALGRAGRNVFRLQLLDAPAPPLRLRYHVLPALGGYRLEGAGAPRARESSRFEAPGGLLTSTTVTGNQWDAPFGWAPLQMIAVAGPAPLWLRRGRRSRLARSSSSLVAKEFDEHGTIVEKYDVRRRESDVAADIKFGYSANQIGFGWTNAAFVELLAGVRSRLRAERGLAQHGRSSRAIYGTETRSSSLTFAGGSKRASAAATSAGLNPNGPAALL